MVRVELVGVQADPPQAQRDGTTTYRPKAGQRFVVLTFAVTPKQERATPAEYFLEKRPVEEFLIRQVLRRGDYLFQSPFCSVRAGGGAWAPAVLVADAGSVFVSGSGPAAEEFPNTVASAPVSGGFVVGYRSLRVGATSTAAVVCTVPTGATEVEVRVPDVGQLRVPLTTWGR